jgi:hypothetical protein
MFQGGLRSLDAHIGGEFAVSGDVPFANAGALDDPFVAGVDALGEVSIGDDFARQIAARPENNGAK